MTRVCKKCNVEQEIDQFLKEKTKDGRGHRCKSCIKAYQSEYQIKNKKSLNEYSRNRYYKDKTRYLERSKQQKESDPEKYKQYQKEYRKKNRVRLGKYDLNRYHSDTRRKLRQIIGGGIRKQLKGETKKSNSINYIGCTWEFLIGYLESKFSSEMNWDNIGSKWHLDHITPCRAFDFNDDEQIKKCFHYTNLQPLLVTDNCSKQDRMPDGTLARNLLTRTQL